MSIGRTENKLGQRGSNTTEVILDEVRVPVQNILGVEGKGFLLAMKDFDMSRPAVAAQALGIAEGAFEVMVRYAKERRTFGKAIAEHQLIQAILADSATLIEASRGLVYRAAKLYDEGRQNTKLASMAKCFAGDAAMKVTTDAVQVLGGYGYMKDFPVERMFRDAKLTQIFEGTNQIQRLVIAREILKETGDRLDTSLRSSGNRTSCKKFLPNPLRTSLPESSFPRRRNEDSGNVRVSYLPFERKLEQGG